MQGDLDEVNKIIEQDPFHQHQIADYQKVLIHLLKLRMDCGAKVLNRQFKTLPLLTKPPTTGEKIMAKTLYEKLFDAHVVYEAEGENADFV